MRKKWGAAEYHKLFWTAAKATYEGEFMLHMDQLKQLDEGAWSWLMKIPKSAWSIRTTSSYPQYEILLNNICEIFNSSILQARDKPILSMLKWIRRYLLDRWMANRDKLAKYERDIKSSIRKKLELRVQRSARWTSRWSGEKLFEVSYITYRFMVNLDDRTRSCKAWQMSGVSSPNSISAIYYGGGRPEDFISNYFSRHAYTRCYDRVFSPLNTADMWPPSMAVKPDPPHMKTKKPGRPKKQRMRDPFDAWLSGEPATKLTRKGSIMRCSRCGHTGHNTRTCDYKSRSRTTNMDQPQNVNL